MWSCRTARGSGCSVIIVCFSFFRTASDWSKNGPHPGILAGPRRLVRTPPIKPPYAAARDCTPLAAAALVSQCAKVRCAPAPVQGSRAPGFRHLSCHHTHGSTSTQSGQPNAHRQAKFPIARVESPAGRTTRIGQQSHHPHSVSPTPSTRREKHGRAHADRRRRRLRPRR